MAYKTKAECEKEFVQHLIMVGIEKRWESYNNGRNYYFFNLKNGEERYWTNLSEESLFMLTCSEFPNN